MRSAWSATASSSAATTERASRTRRGKVTVAARRMASRVYRFQITALRLRAQMRTPLPTIPIHYLPPSLQRAVSGCNDVEQWGAVGSSGPRRPPAPPARDRLGVTGTRKQVTVHRDRSAQHRRRPSLVLFSRALCARMRPVCVVATALACPHPPRTHAPRPRLSHRGTPCLHIRDMTHHVILLCHYTHIRIRTHTYTHINRESTAPTTPREPTVPINQGLGAEQPCLG